MDLLRKRSPSDDGPDEQILAGYDALRALFGTSNGGLAASGDAEPPFASDALLRQGAVFHPVAVAGPFTTTMVTFMLVGAAGELIFYVLAAWRFRKDRRWVETVATEFR